VLSCDMFACAVCKKRTAPNEGAPRYCGHRNQLQLIRFDAIRPIPAGRAWVRAALGIPQTGRSCGPQHLLRGNVGYADRSRRALWENGSLRDNATRLLFHQLVIGVCLPFGIVKVGSRTWTRQNQIIKSRDCRELQTDLFSIEKRNPEAQIEICQTESVAEEIGTTFR